MKKTRAVLLSLILIFIFASQAFAAVTEIDSFTGETGGGSSSGGSQQVRISSSCYYHKLEGYFVYSLSENADNIIKCTVYNGEVTTKSVDIVIGDTSKIKIYKDGTLIEASGQVCLDQSGFYTVRNANGDTSILNFTILQTTTGVIDSYVVPNLFNVSRVEYNDKELSVPRNNIVKLEDEGFYKISYYSPDTAVSRTLELNIDHTAPELSISGVNDGIATGPVTIGNIEEESTVVMLRNGEQIQASSQLTDAGTYHIVYTDKAGNSSTYDFTIRVYLNLNSWIFLAFVVALIATIIGFMIYCRKNMRTC